MSSGIQLYSDEKTMIKIGSVCPLFFNPLKDRFSRNIDYIQRFHISDRLLMQILCDDGETPSATLNNEVTGSSTDVNLLTHSFNSFITLYYFTLTGLEDSIYTLRIDGIGTSEPFSFCSSNTILKGTSLIRYSHKDNNSIDNVFWIGDHQQFFEIRYECGFKPSGITLKAEVEQFRNQNQEIIGLYSVPYKTMQLCAGNSMGLPYWFAEHLNKVLCLSKFEVGGTEYVRSESSAVEMSPVMENSQMFFITALVEPRYNEVHGIGGEVQIPSGSANAAGLIINNPKDGQMLVYSGRDGGFINEDDI